MQTLVAASNSFIEDLNKISSFINYFIQNGLAR